MRPSGAIKSENPIAQQRVELLVASPQTKVVELCSQNRLDVLRLNSRSEGVKGRRLCKGIPVLVMELVDFFDQSVLLLGFERVIQACHAKEGRLHAIWFLTFQVPRLPVVFVLCLDYSQGKVSYKQHYGCADACRKHYGKVVVEFLFLPFPKGG